jgi:fumarylacetoacetase
VFGASQKLDFELELGYYIGVENSHGTPITVDQASEHIFGLVLVNDWSARDHQAWEYVPLGPFLSKSFATSVSPWVVSPDALKPFLKPMPSQDPEPLAYLRERRRQVYDVTLEVWLTPAQTGVAQKIATTNTQELYWSLSQQIAHHTVNGCKLQIGDLLATGTISGSTPGSLGSLLEITLNGTQALQLPGGLSRRFLEDLDEVALVAYGQGEDYRVGFGEVRGKILPAQV